MTQTDPRRAKNHGSGWNLSSRPKTALNAFCVSLLRVKFPGKRTWVVLAWVQCLGVVDRGGMLCRVKMRPQQTQLEQVEGGSRCSMGIFLNLPRENNLALNNWLLFLYKIIYLFKVGSTPNIGLDLGVLGWSRASGSLLSRVSASLFFSACSPPLLVHSLSEINKIFFF